MAHRTRTFRTLALLVATLVASLPGLIAGREARDRPVCLPTTHAVVCHVVVARTGTRAGIRPVLTGAALSTVTPRLDPARVVRSAVGHGRPPTARPAVLALQQSRSPPPLG